MKSVQASIISIIQFIFSRPLLAAIVVGTSIHAFFYINQMIAMGHSYLYSQWTLVENHPVFGIGQLAIPYLAPYLVTIIGTMLSGIKQQELMRKFVELNPDIVILLDPDLNVDFANPSATRYLNQFNLSLEQVDQLLPKNYRELVQSQQQQDFKLSVESRMDHLVFSFTFHRTSDSPNIFITGRDTTEKIRVRKQLEQVSSTFQNLTSYLDLTFRDYDPIAFNLNDHFDNLIQVIMHNQDNEGRVPSHLLMANIEDDCLIGQLHRLENGQLTQDNKALEINLKNDRYRIISNQHDLVCSNWEDESETIEQYQQLFHPDIRSSIGRIERFVSYQCSGIAVIGFYAGEKLDPLDSQVLKAFTVLSSSLKRISAESKQTQQAFDYTMDALARASEANDEDTGDHIVRLNEYARVIATELECDAQFIRDIYRSAQMHDVGKIHVDPRILKKPGKLTEQEFNQMKAHPVYGAKILGDSPYLRMAAEIALNHHEKFNGGGYPRGIKGTEIPLSARIVAIIDVYDALRQERTYKPAFSHQKSVDIISKGDGRTSPDEFDPEVLAAFINTADQLEIIFDNFQDPGATIQIPDAFAETG